MGTNTTYEGVNDPKREGFIDRTPIVFKQAFKAKPQVVVAISEFIRSQKVEGGNYPSSSASSASSASSGGPVTYVERNWGVSAEAIEIANDKFVLYVRGIDTKVASVRVSWIACQ